MSILCVFLSDFVWFCVLVTSPNLKVVRGSQLCVTHGNIVVNQIACLCTWRARNGMCRLPNEVHICASQCDASHQTKRATRPRGYIGQTWPLGVRPGGRPIDAGYQSCPISPPLVRRIAPNEIRLLFLFLQVLLLGLCSSFLLGFRDISTSRVAENTEEWKTTGICIK